MSIILYLNVLCWIRIFLKYLVYASIFSCFLVCLIMLWFGFNYLTLLNIIC
nr:MAG TPA: hypothetical protein [Caudoviricetes sp.]